jgi:hypothetical protein
MRTIIIQSVVTWLLTGALSLLLPPTWALVTWASTANHGDSVSGSWETIASNTIDVFVDRPLGPIDIWPIDPP